MNSNTVFADKEVIKGFLKKDLKGFEIITVKEVQSTNDEAKKLALTVKDGTLIYIAESQTKGRGRMGRSFFSPMGTGIYMSILLHPDLEAEDCTLLTPLCAVAVSQAIEKVLLTDSGIKWVNDIYIKNKKVAGILTEGTFKNGKADYAVVGIGINLSVPEGDFPEDIKNIAGALTEDKTALKNELIAEIVNRFMYYYKKLPEKAFIDRYRSKLFFLGQEITVISPDGNYEAVAEDIDNMCRLKIRLKDASEKILYGGEISIRPKNNS